MNAWSRRQAVLPHYSTRATDVSLARRLAFTAAKLLVAAVYGAMVVLLPPTSMYLLGIPVVVMLLVTLWMLPDRETFPLGVIEWLFPILFVSSVLWPTYLAIALPGLPWLTPTRMLLFLTTFFFVYSIATSSVLRRHLITVARASPAMWLCFLGWEVMQIITIPISKTTSLSFKFFLDNQFSNTVMLFLGCLLFTRPGWAQRIIGMLVVLAAIAAIDGFVELRMEHPPWTNYIPSFMRVDEATLANVLGAQARSADGLYRVHGMAPNSLLFAEFLAMCVPFIIHLVFTGTSIARRLTMSIVFVVVVACIVVTQARLGLVGTIIAVLLYPALWAVRRWRAGNRSIVGPAIVLGFPAIAAMAMVVILSSTTLSNKILGGGAQAASDQARRTQRDLALPKIARNPVGYGLGRSGQTIGFYSPGGVLTVDSGFLSTAVDLGVVGFVSFYGLFLFGAWHGMRLWLVASDPEILLAGPLATAMLAFVTIRLVLAQEQNHWLLFMFVAMILALRARQIGLVGADGTVVKPGAVAYDTPSLPASAPSLARIAG